MLEQLVLTEDIRDYIAEMSLRESDLLREVRERTDAMPERKMQVAAEEGQFLNLLIKATGAKRTIEIGVFTGYSLVSTALALPPDGKVVACELDPEWAKTAMDYCRRAGVADRVDLRVGDARKTLADLCDEPGAANSYDWAFMDADKEGYLTYYERLLTLIRPGGLIVVDNVLWSGKVLDESYDDSETTALRQFNEKIREDTRVDVSMLPLYDGVSLLHKRP
jgi:O-methyltransferase